MEAIAGQILQVADSVAREKDIPKTEVFEALEMAIAKAGRAKYGHEYDIRAQIDPLSGDIKLKRYVTVVADDDEEGFESDMCQIHLSDAQKKDKALKVGDEIIEDLPPIDFGRIAAQSARQVIQQRVKEAERKREFAEFKDKEGEIVNGRIKRVDYGNVVLDLGRAEGFMRRDEQIPRENLRQGDQVRAYIYEVKEDPYGPQIFVSRTHPQFLAKLFEQEVQEVYDGTIEIKAVARDPGSRAKVAVYSNDPSIDPRGACIGMRGSRVQAVKAELREENIDVIQWNEDTATFVVDAIYPAQVTKVVLDEEDRKIEVIVPEDQLSLAIGRRGQNVRLGSQITGWNIDIMTEDQESEKAIKEIEGRAKIFMDMLDVDDVIARLLATEGFASVEDIAFVPLEELTAIQGFDENIAGELKNRATVAQEEKQGIIDATIKKLKVSQDLLDLEALEPEMIVALAESEFKVKTLDDFADLATDELLETLPAGKLTKAKAEALIMKAREHWFEDDEKPAEKDIEKDIEEEKPKKDDGNKA